MFKNYFKTAWRSLIHHKGLSFLNITGLSVGITAAVLIFLWVQNELNFDHFYPDNQRIYRLNTRTADNSWIWEGSPMLLAASVKKEIPEIEQVTRLYADNAPVFNIDGKLQSESQCAYIDPNWFTVFPAAFSEGNPASLDAHPFSIILSASEARKYFGRQAAVGQTIRIDSMNYEVRGVVADAPANSSFQYKAFIPIEALLINKERLENGMNWDNTDYLTFIKLAKNARPGDISKKVTKLLQAGSHDDKNSILSDLVSLKDMHFENNLQASEFEHGNRMVVYIFSLLGILILLVACINYVNLTTAKASLRSKEVSIRKIVGARRGQLFLQFITESLLVSVIALMVSLLLVYLLLPGFNRLTGKTFLFDLASLDIWKVLGTTLAVALLLNSIYPAILLSSFKPLNMSRGVSFLSLKDTNFRKGLVVLQFSIAIMAISGTIVIYRQLHFIQKSNMGYDRSQILTVSIPFNQPFENKTLFMQTMQQQLAALSAVENVSMVNQPLVKIGSSTTGADWDGRAENVKPKVAQLSADAGLAETMHLQLAEGRWFQPANASDKNNFILNETAVRELGIRKPVIGQRFTMHEKTGQIVGVVKDFHYRSMHEKVGSLVVFNNPEWWNYFMIRTKSGDAGRAILAVEKVWKQFAPGIPMEYSFLDERFDQLYRQDQLVSTLVLLFAVITVIISAMGLFGLAAFATERRLKEIGIRKILGASPASIGGLLSRDFIKLVVIAFILASPVAWWFMNSWLENFAYRIDMSWWMIGLSGVLAMLIALLITNYHAVRAALKNPVISLRSQ